MSKEQYNNIYDAFIQNHTDMTVDCAQALYSTFYNSKGVESFPDLKPMTMVTMLYSMVSMYHKGVIAGVDKAWAEHSKIMQEVFNND